MCVCVCGVYMWGRFMCLYIYYYVSPISGGGEVGGSVGGLGRVDGGYVCSQYDVIQHVFM